MRFLDFFRAALVTLPLALTTAAGQAPGPRVARLVPDETTAPGPAPAAAPQLVELRGVVLTPDGRPCAGASVFPAGQPRQLTITDAQGNFVLPVPAGAALALRVEYFGVGSSRVPVLKPSAELLRITLGQ